MVVVVVAWEGGKAGTGPVFFKVLFKPSRNIALLAGDALMAGNECWARKKQTISNF